PWLGIAPIWGTAGLTASAGFAGWIEFALLRRSLKRRARATGVSVSDAARLWGSALVAAAAAWAVRLALPPLSPLLRGAIVLPIFGAVYLGGAFALGVPVMTFLHGRREVSP